MSEDPGEYNLSELISPQKTLADATVQELFDALKRKTTCIITAWVEPHQDNTDIYNAQYGGSWATAKGLCYYFSEWLDGRIPGKIMEDDE